MTEEQRNSSTTPFQTIYDRFLGLITDDMYMEMTKEETFADLQNMLMVAIPRFSFPRFKIYDFDKTIELKNELGAVTSVGQYNFVLDEEEVSILSGLMLVEWISRQLVSVDVTRMKYGSSDFKLTSQANHLDKLLKLRLAFVNDNKYAQKMYGRRKVDAEGYVKPNFSGFGGSV